MKNELLFKIYTLLVDFNKASVPSVRNEKMCEIKVLNEKLKNTTHMYYNEYTEDEIKEALNVHKA